MTRTGEDARPVLDEQSENFFDWIQDHTRQITIVGVLAVAAAVGSWLYVKSRQMQAQRAEESLVRAEQSLQAGNLALAQSDLEKVAKRFGSTPAGQQAELLLGETYYRGGQFQKGIDALSKLAGDKGSELSAVAESQVAVGYEQLRKFADAASHYEKAAAKARFTADSLQYLAAAARAFSSAGNNAEAARIWGGLAEDESSPVAAEARVRLGEMKAQPAKRG